MSRVVERTGRVLALVTAAWAARAGAQQEWRGATCDLKPGHYLVNSGILYLKSAAETKFADKRDKDLHDALRVLDQALTSGGQQKNPAAWYYFGRYYAEIKDGAGADSAFTKAVALAPGCVADVNTYRRQLWVLTGAVGTIQSDPFFAQQAHATVADYLYFSFVTQTTVGYGDLTAAGGFGRALAVLEALIGQLYLVTVIALLVSNLGSARRRARERDETVSSGDPG